jgi:hypothetical protein
MQVFCPLVIPFGHVREKRGIEGVRRTEGVYINVSLSMSDEKKLRFRECPHCHKLISRKNCSFYIIKGSKYPITCNHCGKEVQPSVEAWPFRVGFFFGFLGIVAPTKYYLWQGNGFWESVMKAIPFFLLALAVNGIVNVEFIKFKKTDY